MVRAGERGAGRSGAPVVRSMILGALAGAAAAWFLRTPPPDLSAERARLASLEEKVDRATRIIGELEQELASERATHALLRERVDSLLPAHAERPSRAKPIAPPAELASPTALLEVLFDEVIVGGSLSAAGTTGTRFVGLARTFPREGIDFLVARLESRRDDDRLAAVRLASRFPSAFPIDPLLAPLVGPLTAVASEDSSDLLRILASEALARFPAKEATESWLAILDGSGPAGARVHAWTALARAGHEEAVRGFVPLLDRCDATIPADAVIDTALAMADPRLLPAIRDAFGHRALAEKHQLGILRTLARAGGEWLEFVREVGSEGEGRAAEVTSETDGEPTPALSSPVDPIGERARALARELAPPLTESDGDE